MTTIRFSTSSSPIPPMDSHSYLTLNHLDLTATRNAFDQGKRAFASEDYSQAIRSYTDALNHLYADLESTILLHRAVANEKLRNYDQALEDCAKTNPKNDKAGVYWITSNILLKQGKLEQAGLVYKEALNNIPKDAFPEHKKQFDRMYHAVVAEQVHHNQWLTRTVPYEVLSAILTLLPWSARGQLAFTCRFWYNFVLKEWPEMWSCIDTVYMMPRHPRAIHQLLGKVQPEQVRKVKINLCGLYWCSNDDAYELSNDTTANVQLYGMGDLSRLVLKTILKENWNKITYLDMSPLNNDQLRSVLQVNKDTLKHLTLHHQTNNKHCCQDEMLTDAARICPHLSCLIHQVSGNGINVHNIKTILIPSNLCLTKLILRCPMTLGSLTQVFNSALYLESLEVQNYELNHASVLETIYHHCLHLHSLVYLGKVHYCTGSFSATYFHSEKSRSASLSNGGGIESLVISIRMDQKNFELDRIIGLILRRNRNSLRDLRLEWKPDTQMSNSTILLEKDTKNSGIYFSKLQKLILGCEASGAASTNTMSSHHTQRIITQLLSLSPNLQEVGLQCAYYYFANNELYHILGKFGRLSRLTIDFYLCRGIINNNNNSINSNKNDGQQIDVISAIITNGLRAILQQNHNLRYLKLIHSNRQIYQNLGIALSNITVDMMTEYIKDTRLVSLSSSLCELDILNIEFKTNDQLVTILENLKDSSVKTLKARWPSRQSVTEKELVALASLERLEYLEILAWYAAFNKPKLLRLFEIHDQKVYQQMHVFIVKIKTNDGQYLSGHKLRFFSLLNTTADSRQERTQAQCLHKKYSISDKSVYRKDDIVEDVFCEECNARHQWRVLS